MKLKPLKIGKLKINPPILLAPMVDVTDLPYRLICRKAGAQLCYTEMLYVDAIIYENKKTQKLMQTNKQDSPLGIQITGNKLEHFEKAIPYLKKYDFVDLNCGCPSEKLIKSQAGSFLLNNPGLISKIIKLLKKHNLVVTAKIRLGFEKNNVLGIAKEIENAGADAITIHPRLATHGYNVKADWNEIKKLKEKIKIPLIANGDILSLKDALSIIKQTNCDGIMIARGAIGNPFLFKQINHYLKTGKEIPFNFEENLKYLKDYIKLCKKYKFEDLSRIKRISCKFIHGFRGASETRNKIMQLKDIRDLEKEIISAIESQNRLD
jgi:nifR3 family TIM-barrel protein